MKKGTDKKRNPDFIDSKAFLKSVLPNIKINEKNYPLNDFHNNPSKETPEPQKPTSVKPN